ncbi:MAG TPA: aminodeoxychorismate synthase component I, partial [Actinomycetota bacterium]|nr:aminodeoxychorismate synthase component I [Actinomycetota bacterium]
ARFDDLRPGRERSFRLTGQVGVIQARALDEVGPALDRVEEAARGGRWAAGFVAYEASPGLDPAMSVRGRERGDPFAALPLLSFAIFERREDVAVFEPVAIDPPATDDAAWTASIDRAQYDASVAAIRERIAAGDTYQVNYTFRLRAEVHRDEGDLYRDLCLSQRGGYAAHLSAGRFGVLSASPELFFRIEGDRITTSPMKGTAPRGRWPGEDEENAGRLASSPKDRAENAMVVDLLRSDLGRISVPGTVRASRLFDTERYETVWQLTSTVRSMLRPGISLSDAFRALFPSGSVTGAPKVSTMGLIAELEDAPRGPYCGAIGYLAPPGSGKPRANFNVAIRTVVRDRRTGLAEFGVGGGITYDSSAAGEFDEAVAKTRVLTARRPRFELLETLRHEPASGFRHLREHLARLAASAHYFGFAFVRSDAEAVLEKAVAELGGAEGVVRLLLARDGSLRIDLSEPQPSAPGSVRVAIHPRPVDPSDVWLYHKTTLRGPYERRRDDRPEVDDVLLVNTRGEVTESTIANVAVKLGKAWFTPSLGSGLLAGTYRAVLLREGRFRERSIRIEELGDASGLALISSVRGWRPAVLVQ